MNASTTGRTSVPMIACVTERNDANSADSYRFLVRKALNANLDPATIDISGVPRAAVFFPAALAARIQEVADKHAMTFPEACAGLAAKGADALITEREGDVEIIERIPFKNLSIQQAAFFSVCRNALANSRIVVAEASTGVGKTRALVAAGIGAAQAGKTPVIITVPTVEGVAHFWAELESLRLEGVGLSVSAAIAPGAGDFVDDTKLKEWLSDNPGTDLPVEEWVNAGAPLCYEGDDKDKSALTKAAAERGIELAWLMEDLERLVENMPVTDFRLQTSTLKKGEVSASKAILNSLRGNLLQHNEEGKYTGPAMIFCTHAMLASAQAGRWRILPPPNVLIIDEAHLIEETLSRANSDEVSIYSLRSRLAVYARAKKAKKGSKPVEAIVLAKNLEKICQGVDIDDNKSSVCLTDFPKESQMIADAAKLLASVMGSTAFNEFTRKQGDIIALNGIATGIHSPGHRTDLRFSPDRRYPLIISGAADIAKNIGEIWKVAEGGAILASATLYTMDDYGQDECKYIVKNLSIPLNRIETPPPIVSPAVYGIPTLYTPTAELAQQLSRPNTKEYSPESEKAWLSTLGQEIADEVAPTAKGGTLVLLTSYKQIKLVEESLLENSVPKERIVVMVQGKRFALAKRSFIDSYREGKRPIFLALGPAWTGLDLADKTADAFNDFLLSDVVIGCSPIGLNQSPTMQRRKDLGKLLPVIKEACMVFKQGIGRLIRRNGVTDRRLWIMDGRIFCDWPSMAGFTASTRRLLLKYRNSAKFG